MDKTSILSSLGLVLFACQNTPDPQPSAAAPIAEHAAAAGSGATSSANSALAVGASSSAPKANAASDAPASSSGPSAAAANGNPAAPSSNTAAPDDSSAPVPSSSSAAAPGGATPPTPDSGAAAAPSSSTDAISCTLPERYARASRVAIDLSWPETLVWAAGSDQFVAWLKNTYQTQPDGSTLVESRPCGALMPIMTSTDFVGGLKSSAQIPFSAFESPSLPVLHSTLRVQANTPVTRDLTLVLGASLRDPQGAWPMGSELMPTDDDGDGAPGMTVIPEEGPEFLQAPTSVSQLEFIDRLYIATRARMMISATPTCDGASKGTLDPVGFDSSMVGCHVKGRDACTAEELRFVTTQNPRFKLGQTGSWVETDVPLDASCETVRATLP